MTEPEPSRAGVTPAQADRPGAAPPALSSLPLTTPSSLDALRETGAERFDPARFAYLEAMARRLPLASGELRQILQGKLDAAVLDYEARLRQAQQAAADEIAQLLPTEPDKARAMRQRLKAGDHAGLRRLRAPTQARPDAVLLRELNQYIDQAAQAAGGPPQAGRSGRVELKSVRRFREVWSRVAAARQLEHAMGRGPENAGPLNSHLLVLRSLALMRERSPDYLRRFLSHVDSLLWLEAQSQRLAPADAKPARRSRKK